MASLAEFLQAQQMMQNQPTALDYYTDISKAQMIPSEIRLKGLEERQKFEDYENTQKLRRLFAESAGMPNIAQVGQYSPEMAIKLQQAQLENMAKQAQIRESGMRTGKIGQEMQLEKGKAFANAIGPYGDQYYMDIQSGMPEGQALNKFRMQTGQALQQLEQQGLTPDVPFDMNQLTPDAALRAASGHGYRSQYLESQQKMGEMGYGSQLEMGRERYKRQLPPAPTAEQTYGGVHMTPQGPMRVPPVMGQPFEVVQPFEMESMQQAPMGVGDIDNLRMMYQQAKGPQKEQLGRMLADAIKSQIAGRSAPPSGFISPEQRTQRVVEEKAAETKATEEAKAQVAQSEAKRQKADVLASLPKVPEINKLIDRSMSGQIEAVGKGKLLGEMAGVSTEALTATKELEVIAAQMKQITKSLVGAGAVSDFEQRQMAEAAGNIADPKTPAEARKRQLGMFNRIIRKSLMKSPELVKGLNEEDDSVEEEPAEAPSVKSGSKPKIGQVESGYRFKGGDPANPDNWEKQ